MWWWTCAAALAQVEPHFSYPKLLSSNGYGVVIFNGGNAGGAVLDGFSDHLYKQLGPESPEVRDLLYDTYFGARIDGDGGWLTSAEDARMITGTNVIEIERRYRTLRFTEVVFAPLDLERPGFVHLLRIENDTAATARDVSLFALMNHHLGSTSNEAEHIGLTEEGALVERGQDSDLWMHYVPLVPPTQTGCSPDNPWQAVNEGRSLTGCVESSGDDRVGAYEWVIGDLAPGESAWVGQVQVFSSGTGADAADDAVRGYVEATDAFMQALDGYEYASLPQAIQDREQLLWGEWLAQGVWPEGMTHEEEDVYAQALAFLRMGQVREPGDAYGQLLASLPASTGGTFSHTWNIAWVRDGAYAIAALSRAGYVEEARAALLFQLQPGKSGFYRSYVYDMDYTISVCRLYGDGTEWTDDDGTGPNIEFDNFGLYLWALSEYVDASGDTGLLAERREDIFGGVADVLAGLVDAETGLIVADSSIWERHWNGHQKRFTYTSAWAVGGLRAAASMARQIGEDSRAERYEAVASGVAAAIAEHLVRYDGVLVGNYEEELQGHPAMDLAAVEAFNVGALDPTSQDFRNTLAAWDETLAVESGHGYARNDDGDLYDVQEWVMVDLRLAHALDLAGQHDRARAIERWITSQALENRLIIPELMDPASGDYAGPAPMMGFGSGLYVLRLHERAALGLTGDPGNPGPSDSGGNIEDPDSSPWDTGKDDDARGCGCAGAPGIPPIGVLLICAVILRRRTEQGG
ncbi:MAG: glycoside hydrolase family 15 protein [Alphaproteobacteria bacterium]|nr:glycoside hydrolase family 15 protein [Alphaproteobacteria bacterium]